MDGKEHGVAIVLFRSNAVGNAAVSLSPHVLPAPPMLNCFFMEAVYTTELETTKQTPCLLS